MEKYVATMKITVIWDMLEQVMSCSCLGDIITYVVRSDTEITYRIKMGRNVFIKKITSRQSVSHLGCWRPPESVFDTSGALRFDDDWWVYVVKGMPKERGVSKYLL